MKECGEKHCDALFPLPMAVAGDDTGKGKPKHKHNFSPLKVK